MMRFVSLTHLPIQYSWLMKQPDMRQSREDLRSKYFLQIFCFQENLNSAELSGKCQIRLLASESYDDRIFVENALQGFPKALSLSATSGSLFRPLRMWRKRIFRIIFVIGQFYFTIFVSFQNHSIDNNDRREVFKKLQQLKVVSKGGAH